MTRTLNAMEKRELVRREKNAQDSRSVLVSLTAEGRAVVDRVLASRESWMVRHLEGLPAEDLKTLARAARVLTRIGQE